MYIWSLQVGHSNFRAPPLACCFEICLTHVFDVLKPDDVARVEVIHCLFYLYMPFIYTYNSYWPTKNYIISSLR